MNYIIKVFKCSDENLVEVVIGLFSMIEVQDQIFRFSMVVLFWI